MIWLFEIAFLVLQYHSSKQSFDKKHLKYVIFVHNYKTKLLPQFIDDYLYRHRGPQCSWFLDQCWPIVSLGPSEPDRQANDYGKKGDFRSGENLLDVNPKATEIVMMKFHLHSACCQYSMPLKEFNLWYILYVITALIIFVISQSWYLARPVRPAVV